MRAAAGHRIGSRESGPDFQALFESAPGLFLAVAADAPRFTIVAVSDAYARATRTTREQILGRGVSEVVPDGDPTEPSASGVRGLRASLQRVLQDRAVDAMAVQRRDLDEREGEGAGREERWWRPVNSPVFGADGEVIYVIHRIEDVTELVRREAQWSSLVEQAPDGIFVADLDGRYTSVNDAGCRMLGYARDEIIGKTIVDLLPPADVPRLLDSKAALLEGSVHVAEWTLRKKDGGSLPVEVSAKILPDGRWQGFVRDISERKLQAQLGERARERTRESEERFRLVFEWAPIGMALVALDGTFVRVNNALCEIVGYSAEELTGRTFQEITYPEDLDADLELVGRLYRGEIPRYQLAKRYVRKDGAVVDVMLFGSVLRDERGNARHFIAEIEDITERKRREEELHRTRERLDLALRGADLATWDWNIRSGEVVFNRRWAQMRGYRPEEVRGHVDTWTSGIHPEDRPRVQHALEEHFQGRRAQYEAEHRARTKSGEWIWILDRGRVVARGERGEPVRMVGTELDITPRKQAEEALRLAEAKSSGILSISADAIISIDKDQRITLFNAGAETIFGYAREEIVGAPLDVLIPERFRAVHGRQVERFSAGADVSQRMGARTAVPIVGLRKNGEEFPADAAISKLEVGGERILTVVLRDVTEQKRVEREQRFLAEVGPVLATSLQYEETLSKVAELAVRELADLCIVDIVEEDGEIRRLKGLARDPAKAWVADALMRIPLDRERPHLVSSVLETKQPVLIERVTEELIASWAQSEEHRKALRGLAARSIIAVPLLVRGELLGVLKLVSATRSFVPADLQLANELASRAALSIENARLYRAANRAVQVRDEVLGIVAHDLRNPLHAILLGVSSLRGRGGEPGRLSRTADMIERSADRMNRLIEDLLDVARMEAGRLSIARGRVGTVRVITDALEAQTPLAASASIELVADLAPGLPDVAADRDRLLQVLENLIGNAVKFTEPGGRITVGAAPREGELLVWVADTGRGITAEDIAHLFDRFWQARRDGRRGAGLGLPIVRGIVEAHGGRVWVKSTPGRGSTFYFTIPTAPHALHPAGPAPHSPAQTSSRIPDAGSSDSRN